MKKREKQQGFLLIVAVVLIAIFGVIGVIATYLVNSDLLSGTNHLDSEQAFYIAEAGLETATHRLRITTVSNTTTCASMGGNSNVTNVTFTGAKGPFSVTGTVQSSSASTLNGAVSASATTIPVNDISTYATSGRLMIDKELIDYSNISGNSFIHVRRGVNTTLAAAHVSGTGVGQYQCLLTSKGSVPSVSPPGNKIGGERTLQEAVQLPEAWAVGTTHSAKGSIIHWNNPTELQWTDVSTGPNQDFYAISALSYADAWLVGAGGTILHWNGNLWSTVSSSTVHKLQSVACSSSNSCLAVGIAQTFLIWNGSSWSTQAVSVPNVAYTGITCNANNDCWAVGAVSKNNDVMVHWDGSAWSRDPSTPKPENNLFGVDCVNTNDCWAVGDARTFIHWNGTAWSAQTVSALPNVRYRVVDCVASNDCWAVGDGGDTYAHWNGTAWSSDSSTPGANNLYSLKCSASNDCWAGDDGGITVHWDGSTWTKISNPLSKSVIVRGIDVVSSRQQPLAAWQEIFPPWQQVSP